MEEQEKKGLAPDEPKDPTPIEKWARAHQWTEGIIDALGIIFLLAGITLVILGISEFSVLTAQYEPFLKPVLPFLTDIDQRSAALAQLYIGVACLLLSIVTLARSRVVKY